MINPQQFFFIAAIAYAASGAAAVTRRGRTVIMLFLLIGMAFNSIAVGLRYWHAWPMMPMHLGPLALPLCLGILSWTGGLWSKEKNNRTGLELRLLSALLLLSALPAVFFPKDYYLPFLKSNTIFSHIFFLFSVLGKTCFLIGALKAVVYLRSSGKGSATSPEPGLDKTMHWVIWGFAFWTLSMFAGGIWSYLGWGTPVVWEDAAITLTMAAWFYYICLLHLHLTGTWNMRKRALFTIIGTFVILGLNCHPDMGPLRLPCW